MRQWRGVAQWIERLLPIIEVQNSNPETSANFISTIMYDHYTSSLWILLIREINNWRQSDVDELALSAHNNIRHKVNLEFQ